MPLDPHAEEVEILYGRIRRLLIAWDHKWMTAFLLELKGLREIVDARTPKED